MEIDPGAEVEWILNRSAQGLYTLDEVRAIARVAFARGCYVHTMEAFEVTADGRQIPRIDLGIQGLEPEFNDRAKVDSNSAEGILNARLTETSECADAPLFNVWLDDLAT